MSEHVTRRQHHAGHVLGVPCGKDHSSVVGVCAELVYDLRQLVNTLAGVIGLCVFVLCAKVSPLETVDGSQVADFAVCQPQIIQELAGAIAVPDLDADLVQRDRRCVALNEPE